jgi:hypothetical protein
LTLTFNRMLADAEYFNSRISKLEGAGDLGSQIVDIVKSKTVVVDPQSQPPLPESLESSYSGKDAVVKAETNGERGET